MKRPDWTYLPDFEWWMGLAVVLFVLGVAGLMLGLGVRVVRWGFGL